MGARVTGLRELQDDLRQAADDAVDGAKKVVGQGCNNIKKDAQRIIRGASRRGYLPHYPRAISYDVTTRGMVVSGEVGPKPEKLQGGLGRILEYGTVNNAPIPHMSPALDIEDPKFVRYMEELGVRLLEGQEAPDGPVVDPGVG
jgi:hypothetical protein